MEKKRLLIFHPTIAPYRIDFFNRLNEVFETQICLQYWNLKDQTFDYQKIYDQFEFIPTYLPEGSNIALIKAIWKQIREFKPDIILTCEFGLATLTSLTAKLLRKNCKIVVMTDDSYDMVAEGHDFTPRHRRARQLISRYVDDLIVVSPQVEHWYQLKYHKGIWMPIIVDDDKAIANYERLLPKSVKLAEKYNIVGEKVLLSVSRLVDLKNLHKVIDAFAKCESDACLVMVGDGPERESLKEHASKVDKQIIIPGRFDGDELYAWYNLASAFVLASYKEAFGAVTNEALLAGCRVVISNKAGSSCLVNAKNGELVDPLDVDGMANAIDRQLNLVSVPDMQTGRKSLMTVTFEERMANLIRVLMF